VSSSSKLKGSTSFFGRILPAPPRPPTKKLLEELEEEDLAVVVGRSGELLEEEVDGLYMLPAPPRPVRMYVFGRVGRDGDGSVSVKPILKVCIFGVYEGGVIVVIVFGRDSKTSFGCVWDQNSELECLAVED